MADEELAKDLGLLSALTIGIGTMVGAGIFVLPGAAVGIAGPLAAASFVLGGVIALFTALSASELGTAMPKSGGAYYYINQGLGPLFGSIAGWGNWIGLAFASAFYMFGFGEYVAAFVAVPDVSLGPLVLSAPQVIGLAGAALFIGINYIGAEETGKLQNFIVVILLLILIVFTLFGLVDAELQTLQPVAPDGFGALLPATGLIFVSYLGFVQITSVAEEIKNPGRNLPIAIIGSVVIVTAIYAVVLVVALSAVPTEVVVDNETAVVDAAELLIGPIGAVAMLFGGLLATASSANASILASSRINFAMGRDKIVSPKLNDIHERFGTPYRSIAVTGALILIFIVFGNLELLSAAGSLLHLVVYGLLNVALIVFREAEPTGYDPDFTVPLYPIVPVLGAVLSFGLIAFIEPLVIILCGVFIALSIVWYLFYARSRTENEGVLSAYILSEPEAMPDLAVSAASSVRPIEKQETRILVPLSNPRTEQDLITLASTIAKQRGGTVHAVHIVEVPDQTSLAQAAEHIDQFDPDSSNLLERAKEDATTADVPIETHTIASHRSFEEVFDAARTLGADVTVMGWSGESHWPLGRASRALDELARDLPCDFLILKDRGFDPSRVLVPTAGGPDSDLSAEIATTLRDGFDAEITLLHVVNSEDDREEGKAFLTNWASNHDLTDAELRIDPSGDIEDAIGTAADENTMVVIGATDRGLLARLIRGSLVYDIVNEVESSVLLAERPTKQSLRERLLGRGRRTEQQHTPGD